MVRTTIILLLLASFAHSQTPVKIKIYQSSIYDLSGRIMHKDRPFNYFDGFETIDPKNGDVTFSAQAIPDDIGRVRMIKGDTTNAIPGSGRDQAYFYEPANHSDLAYAGYYFPGKRGRCILIDLMNYENVKQAYRMGNKYHLTDIYGLEQNFEAGDTLYFYNFDTVFAEPNLRKRAYMISRPDSCLTPFAFFSTTGGTGGSGMAWRNLSVNTTCRWLMIRNTLQNRGYISTAYHNELVFYGYPTGDSAKPWGSYNGPLPKQKSIYDKLGVNTGVQIQTGTMGHYKNIRFYMNVDYFDDDTTHATKYKQLFNAEMFPGYYAWDTYWRDNNKNLFVALFGASKRAGYEMGASVRNNIDTPRSEPGDFLHYVSHGRLWYQMAYKFGHNTSLDGSKYRWRNDTVVAGYAQNWYPYLELGNEDDTYEPPSVSAAKLVMAVNGNGNYLGDTLGIRNADPGMKIIYAGQTYPDSFRIRTVMLLAELMSNDTITKWFDVFSYHSYSRQIDTVIGIVGPTYEEQIGNAGIVPERNKWLDQCDNLAKFMYRITGGDTTIETWNTEFGYDNNSLRTTNTTQLAGNYTTTATPLLTGYDSVQSKAISMLRMYLIMCASKLQGVTEFNMHNSNLDETNNVPLNFYTSGQGGGDYSLSTKFPNYYSTKWFIQRMGNYVIDQIIAKDSTGLWVMKWRSQSAPDSVMYSIWKGTETGATQGASFSVNPVVGNTYQKEVYNFSTHASTITTLSGSSTVSLTAYEMPTFLFAKEDSNPTIKLKRGRFRIQ